MDAEGQLGRARQLSSDPDRRTGFLLENLKNGMSFSAGVVDSGGAPCIGNIFTNFRDKNSNWR